MPQPNETIIHNCPACGKPSRVPASMAGRQVRCPHCKVPGQVAESSPPPAPDEPKRRPTSNLDQMKFATEKDAPILQSDDGEDATGGARRTASGLHRRPASGIQRRPTSGRTQGMPRQNPSGRHVARRSTAGLDAAGNDKTLWIVVGAVAVLALFLVAALIFLMKTN